MQPTPDDVRTDLEPLVEENPLTTRELLPQMYEELRRLARQKLVSEPHGLTLQTTALVNEAFLRLTGRGDLTWDNRGHFFAAAAEAMRRILIERARRVGRLKHGGGRRRLPMEHVDPADDASTPLDDDLLAIDRALAKLEATDPERATIVKLRYFGGLTMEQTADLLDSPDRPFLIVGPMREPGCVRKYWQARTTPMTSPGSSFGSASPRPAAWRPPDSEGIHRTLEVGCRIGRGAASSPPTDGHVGRGWLDRHPDQPDRLRG